MSAGPLVVDGLAAHSREFYTGRPIWERDGLSYNTHPGGYERLVEGSTGVVKWARIRYPEVMEAAAFW